MAVGHSFYVHIHPDDLELIVALHEQLRQLNVHRSPFVQLVVGETTVVTVEVSVAEESSTFEPL